MFVVLLLLCNGAVPKRWKRYQGAALPIIRWSPCATGRRQQRRQQREQFRAKGDVSKRHMAIPVCEVLLACVFGTVFGVCIGRLGVPPGYGGCRTTGAEVRYLLIVSVVLVVDIAVG